MAFDAFLEIDGIDGESTDDQHQGTIEVDSWSFGASNPSTVGPGGGGGAGKVSIQDFHIMKRVDAASPLLFLACATGQHIKSAKLFVRKAGDRPQDYLTYTFTDCMVSSFAEDGGGGSAAGAQVGPTEEIALRFRRIQMEYRADSGKVTSAGWDLATNKKA